MKLKILSETPITLAETRVEVDNIKKRDNQVNFRVERVEDYLNNFLRLSPKKAEELKKKIIDLNIPRMRDALVCKIVDLLPRNIDELKTITQSYPITITNENLKKILDVVSEYTKK